MSLSDLGCPAVPQPPGAVEVVLMLHRREPSNVPPKRVRRPASFRLSRPRFGPDMSFPRIRTKSAELAQLIAVATAPLQSWRPYRVARGDRLEAARLALPLRLVPPLLLNAIFW